MALFRHENEHGARWDKRADDDEPSWIAFVAIMAFGLILAVVCLPWAIAQSVWKKSD